MNWKEFIELELDKDYMQSLQAYLRHEEETNTVYPSQDDTFRAFQLCPLKDTRVVILGQDPYHGEGQANGLAFSVDAGEPLPPSLKNIYKELALDVGCEVPKSGDLSSWAAQGVLLLNTVLTVRAGEAGSHAGMGWEHFTKSAVKLLAEQEQPPVFILWGNKALNLFVEVFQDESLTADFLYAPHPSPLSASKGFIGCRHFTACNDILKNKGLKPIKWEIS